MVVLEALEFEYNVIRLWFEREDEKGKENARAFGEGCFATNHSGGGGSNCGGSCGGGGEEVVGGCGSFGYVGGERSTSAPQGIFPTTNTFVVLYIFIRLRPSSRSSELSIPPITPLGRRCRPRFAEIKPRTDPSLNSALYCGPTTHQTRTELLTDPTQISSIKTDKGSLLLTFLCFYTSRFRSVFLDSCMRHAPSSCNAGFSTAQHHSNGMLVNGSRKPIIANVFVAES
ncbi:hypothetical protein BJ508DRAFT_309140 [Ascobolus immersus RN42]|uniref:Uncharacterized protein n=1 Tax=Ascobolus immersus RN42 TaxID=1160509 RepID=A0A3N4I2P2_ASCIM|nr:hypothetical protein BJ508DRAFT_309140 [Ascobolus immersus RN42]